MFCSKMTKNSVFSPKNGACLHKKKAKNNKKILVICTTMYYIYTKQGRQRLSNKGIARRDYC